MLYLFIIPILCTVTANCQSSKNTQEKLAKSDTLKLGYMYWANDFTPFGFGSRYTLIFKGAVTGIKRPSEISEDAIYTPVEGSIAIEEIILDAKAHGRDMTTISHITTDCFEGTSISKGDQVLVFCVSYEGDYAITGKQSIIKIPKNDKRYITSIKKYINGSYNPSIIEKDIKLWNNTSAGKALEDYLRDYKEYIKG